MKNFMFALLMSVLSLAGFSQTYSVNIQGTVQSQEDGNPVSGQVINIMTDSLVGGFFYYNSVFTDANGFYQDSFDVPSNIAGTIIVSTINCDFQYLGECLTFSENASNFTVDFVVCTEPSGGDCQAMFSYYPSENSMTTIQFLDQSIGNPGNWQWNFGDGTYSEEQNPIHSYATEGMYVVGLNIFGSDSSDCFSTIQMDVWVGNDSIWPNDCIASFYFMPDSLSSLTYQFIDMSVGSNGSNPETWYWDFGDNNNSTEQNPTHTYANVGTYNVCLTITDSSEVCENTMCYLIDIIDWENYCQAQFYYYPVADSNPVGNGLTFQFIDFSFGNPDTWMWDFGDGNTSNEQNPVHSFEDITNAQVCLSISNSADSCESTYCEYIYNNDTTYNCYGWFEYTTNEMTIDFQGYALNSNEGTFGWEFGDGTTGAGQSVSHTYTSDGVYPVTMTLSDSVSGCFSVYTAVVWVGELSFNVEGYVYLADSMLADQAFVYLMAYDTVGNGLINVSTTEIDANGYFNFEEVGTPYCIYFIQAELKEGSAYFGEYVPTYHYSAMNWVDANPVLPFFIGYYSDIYMIPAATYNSGIGLIEGTVNASESRGAMDNIEIMLLNEAGEPLTYLYTDENGLFDFSEIAFGTYIVYAEIPGITTLPVTITLTEENPSATISIVVANGEAVLGISAVSANIESVGEVFPNPVSNNAQLIVNMKQASDVQLQITDIYGRVLASKTAKLNQGAQIINIETGQFSPGFYLYRISANDGMNFIKKFIKQ